LSYNKESLLRSLIVLNGYDLIVFAHPSPHPTKSNLEHKSSRGWQAFYTKTRAFKIAVFHDRHWDRSNSWISEVRAYVNYVHAAQHHFVDAVARFAESDISHGWGMFPLLIQNTLSLTKKYRRFVLATQWLSIKNHRFLIPRLNELKIPLHSYGSGQMYHKLLSEMKRVYYEDHHYDKPLRYNSKSSHIHYGHVEYRKLLNALRQAWFSLDLSIQGMTNMTHWEPMTVGTVSVLEERVLQDSFCEIPRDCCLTFRLDNIIEDLNRISRVGIKRLSSIRSRAWRFVQQCECSQVAFALLKNAKVV
jgi:hypothetical protein